VGGRGRQGLKLLTDVCKLDFYTYRQGGEDGEGCQERLRQLEDLLEQLEEQEQRDHCGQGQGQLYVLLPTYKHLQMFKIYFIDKQDKCA
jgi:hypothetical protein